MASGDRSVCLALRLLGRARAGACALRAGPGLGWSGRLAAHASSRLRDPFGYCDPTDRFLGDHAGELVEHPGWLSKTMASVQCRGF